MSRMTFQLEGPVLEGDLVRLEPLDHRHADDLALAAEADRSTYDFTWVPKADEVGDYIDAQYGRAATGKLAPYAQISTASGRWAPGENGRLRDSAIFSITAAEWPETRAQLEKRLASYAKSSESVT